MRLLDRFAAHLQVVDELDVDGRLVGGHDDGDVLVVGLNAELRHIVHTELLLQLHTLPSITQTSSSSMLSASSVAVSMDEM